MKGHAVPSPEVGAAGCGGDGEALGTPPMLAPGCRDEGTTPCRQATGVAGVAGLTAPGGTYSCVIGAGGAG